MGSGDRIRLGAVSYLNTKPLVHGLEAEDDLFNLRFDVPAVCASLLHEGHIDLGLIPAIEYLRGSYSIVPGVAIGSDGPVASVAIFSTVPVERVRSIALDTSSRTSVALTRILCAEKWGIEPVFTAASPDLTGMLRQADAALVIGDPALEIDTEAAGLLKVDLGEEWKHLTRLPFVYAMWCGPAGVCEARHVTALNAARDRGVSAIDDIAQTVGGGDAAVASRAQRYLRDNLRYGLSEREIAGLRRFHQLAVSHGVASATRDLTFFPAS